MNPEPLYGLNRYLLKLRFMLVMTTYVEILHYANMGAGAGLQNVVGPLKEELLQEIVNVEYRIADPHEGY